MTGGYQCLLPLRYRAETVVCRQEGLSEKSLRLIMNTAWQAVDNPSLERPVRKVPSFPELQY